MKLTRIAVIRDGWLPTRQANGVQVVRMCEALARLGLEVTLYYIPSPVQKDDIANYYDIRTPFALKPLPRAVLPWRKRFNAETWASLPSFGHAVIWSGVVAHFLLDAKADLVLVREPTIAWWLGRRAVPTILEMHDLPRGIGRAVFRWTSRQSGIKSIVAVTDRLRADLVTELGAPSDKTMTLHDGVDLERFIPAVGKREARKALGLPVDGRLVVYTGQLHPEKGVDVLLGALPLLDGLQVVIVGGAPEAAERLRRRAKADGLTNLTLIGYVLPSEVPPYLRAADVLVLPHSSRFVHSAYYTSPLKLFEYMASGRPIVASRLPGLEEVLTDGQNALLCEPDDASALAKCICRLVSDAELGLRLSEQAYQDVQRYEWVKRARSLLDFVGYVPNGAGTRID